MRLLTKMFGLLLMINGAFTQADGTTLIHAGKLVDAARGEVLEERTVRVEGDRIASIAEGFTVM